MAQPQVFYVLPHPLAEPLTEKEALIVMGLKDSLSEQQLTSVLTNQLKGMAAEETFSKDATTNQAARMAFLQAIQQGNLVFAQGDDRYYFQKGQLVDPKAVATTLIEEPQATFTVETPAVDLHSLTLDQLLIERHQVLETLSKVDFALNQKLVSHEQQLHQALEQVANLRSVLTHQNGSGSSEAIPTMDHLESLLGSLRAVA